MTPTENPAGGPLDDNVQPGWSEWYSIRSGISSDGFMFTAAKHLCPITCYPELVVRSRVGRSSRYPSELALSSALANTQVELFVRVYDNLDGSYAEVR